MGDLLASSMRLLSLSHRHFLLLELVFLPSMINLGICVLSDPSQGLPDASPTPARDPATPHQTYSAHISAVD
jgi:hypothetical protein